MAYGLKACSCHPLILVLPRWDHPLENFSLSPQNQKESNLNHPGNLFDILRGHFDGGGGGLGYHLTRGYGKPSKTSG